MWLKRASILALMAGAMLPAYATEAGQNVNLSANVAGFCTFGTPILLGPDNVTAPSLTSTASTVNISTPTFPTGIMKNWSFGFQINGTCNKVSDFALSSLNGGLKDPAHGPGPFPLGFVNRFDYFATASFDGAVTLSLPPTNGSPSSAVPSPSLTSSAWTGPATLHVFSVPNTSGPVMAGTYSDTLTLSLIPQP